MDFNPTELEALARGIVRVGRRMDRLGYCAGTDGNVSVRLPARAGQAHGELAMITPSRVPKGRMQWRQMALIRIKDGQPLTCLDPTAELRPTTEAGAHLAVYRTRPEAGAVIHSHAPSAVAWSCTGLDLPEAIHPEAELMLGRVPIIAYRTPGTPAVGAAISEALTPQTVAMLLANHGTLTFGARLQDAMSRLEALEAYCRLVITLRSIGATRTLTDAEMADLLRVKRELWGLPDDRGRESPVRD